LVYGAKLLIRRYEDAPRPGLVPGLLFWAQRFVAIYVEKYHSLFQPLATLRFYVNYTTVSLARPDGCKFVIE
jgi:hypothetical protein